MSDKIFDLEQEIMQVWSVVDDIDMLYTYLGSDTKFKDMSVEAKDEMMNLLLGLKSLYGVKFERMFKTFEVVCREYHTRGKRIEVYECKPFDDNRIDIDDLHFEAPKGTMLFSDADDALVREWQEIQDSYDFSEHEAHEREDKAHRRSIDCASPEEWDRVRSVHDWNEERIDNIGRNGNDGLHYNKVNKND